MVSNMKYPLEIHAEVVLNLDHHLGTRKLVFSSSYDHKLVKLNSSRQMKKSQFRFPFVCNIVREKRTTAINYM